MVFLITLGVILGLKKGNIDCPRKILALVLGIEIIGVALSISVILRGSQKIAALERPDPGKRREEQEVELQVEQGEWKKTRIEVSPRKPTGEEAEAALDLAETEIRKEYLGKNSSADRVYRRLELKNVYQKVVKAGWSFSPSGLVDETGNIRQEAIRDPVNVKIRGLLRCGDHDREIRLNITIVPLPFSASDALEFYLTQGLKEADREGETDQQMALPESVAGKVLHYRRERKNDGPTVCLMGLGALLLTVFMEHRRKKQEHNRFQASLNQDYPMVLSQLGLFVGAGFSVPAAFAEVGRMYTARLGRGHPKGEGYEAVLTLSRKLKDGCSEQEGYLWLGEKLGNRNFRKLSLLLLANMKKGDSELRRQLEQEENAAFDERKIRARVAGEEASTKLLLPMMGLLGVVLLVLLVPAVNQLGI